MKHGWNTDFPKPVRADIFVASPATNGQSSVRSDIIWNVEGICRPDGAKNGFGFGFYKYAAPNGALGGRDAENGHRDGRAPLQCPSRAANGSLRWTNGANGV
jgi:hypothetical protein